LRLLGRTDGEEVGLGLVGPEPDELAVDGVNNSFLAAATCVEVRSGKQPIAL
jgi:hypothetical protein